MRTWLPALVVIAILAAMGAGCGYIEQTISLLPMHDSVAEAGTYGAGFGAVLGLLLVGVVALRQWSMGQWRR